MNISSLQLIKEIRSTPDFLKSFRLTREDLTFLQDLIVPVAPESSILFDHKIKEADTKTDSILKTTKIFKELKIYKNEQQCSNSLSLIHKIFRIAKKIFNQIKTLFFKHYSKTSPLVEQILSQIKTIQLEHKQPKEELEQRVPISKIPPEILSVILSKSENLNSNRVSRRFNQIMEEHVWRTVAERIGCPNMQTPPENVQEKVKEYWLSYKEMISKLPEITEDIQLALTSKTSIDQMLELKKWKDNRDLFVVWKTLAKHINTDLPPLPRTFHEMMGMEEKLSDWCIENQASLNGLTELDLSNDQLTVLPDWIGNLTGLTKLDLSNNQLTVLPDSIGNLTRLTKLNLSNNQLAVLPASIGNLTGLTELDLSHNQLIVLPDSIGNLTGLTKLNLSHNQLAVLPDWIGNFAQMNFLSLWHNELTVLPDALGKLNQMEWLGLSHNRLTGLPNTLGKLTRMEFLNLSHNRLTGLPDTLGNLTRIKILDLSHNQLNTVSNIDFTKFDRIFLILNISHNPLINEHDIILNNVLTFINRFKVIRQLRLLIVCILKLVGH